MRIIFVNLHGNEMLVKTMDKYVFKHSCAIKHRYILNYLLSHPEYEVCTYINDRGFSLAHNMNKYILSFLQLFKYAENKKVMKLNGINPNKITVIKNISEIKKDDLVILYRHGGDQLYDACNISSYKAVSMLHFWGDKKCSKMLESANIQCMFNEANLSKTSEIYIKNYSWFNGDWTVHPFVYEERFKSLKKFNERLNKAMSVGTITYKDVEDFIEVYGDACDQPSRKQIKDNPDYFKDTIDCYSSDYNEDSDVKPYLETDSALTTFRKKLYNRTHAGQQKKYFSFDMVETFNKYKMCIVGEEILGVPGIGFVEGMACGCAYIGLDSPMYTDYGLIPGKHYITYDGSIEDLRRKIEYYQMPEHQEELETIAKAGCEYVRANFKGEVVAERLMNELIEKQQKWLKEQNNG